MNFDSAFETYMQSLKMRGLSVHTLRAYHNDLKQFREFLTSYFELDTIPLEEIKRLYIRDFLRHLSQNTRSNRTLARKATTIRNFFSHCRKHSLLVKDPAANLPVPKFEKKLPQHFTEDEMLQLLDIPDITSKFGIRNKAIMELIYSSGLRISEVSMVSIGDIDIKRKLIRVLGKGNKERIIPVGKYAITAVKKYLGVRDSFKSLNSDTILFLSKSGKLLSPDELRVILNRYLMLVAKTKGYSPHALRHSF
ncbi:MAG: tyrosine-type recombinase/integrase, partial [Candidatus Cloacimonetes bacterium]|nr:tyrosine-type recombinase/integrase [Candidatus Cloacimonadota bacterium]